MNPITQPPPEVRNAPPSEAENLDRRVRALEGEVARLKDWLARYLPDFAQWIDDTAEEAPPATVLGSEYESLKVRWTQLFHEMEEVKQLAQSVKDTDTPEEVRAVVGRIYAVAECATIPF